MVILSLISRCRWFIDKNRLGPPNSISTSLSVPCVIPLLLSSDASKRNVTLMSFNQLHFVWCILRCSVSSSAVNDACSLWQSHNGMDAGSLNTFGYFSNTLVVPLKLAISIHTIELYIPVRFCHISCCGHANVLATFSLPFCLSKGKCYHVLVQERRSTIFASFHLFLFVPLF